MKKRGVGYITRPGTSGVATRPNADPPQARGYRIGVHHHPWDDQGRLDFEEFLLRYPGLGGGWVHQGEVGERLYLNDRVLRAQFAAGILGAAEEYDGEPTDEEMNDFAARNARGSAAYTAWLNRSGPGLSEYHPSPSAHPPLGRYRYYVGLGRYWEWTGWERCAEGMGPMYGPGYPHVLGPEPDCDDTPSPPDPVPDPPGDPSPPPDLPPDPGDFEELVQRVTELEEDYGGLVVDSIALDAKHERLSANVTELRGRIESVVSSWSRSHDRIDERLAALRGRIDDVVEAWGLSQDRVEESLDFLEGELAGLKDRVEALEARPGGTPQDPPDPPSTPPSEPPQPPADPNPRIREVTQEFEVTYPTGPRGRRERNPLVIELPPGCVGFRVECTATPDGGVGLGQRMPVVYASAGPELPSRGTHMDATGDVGIVVNGHRGTTLLFTGATPVARFMEAGHAVLWVPGRLARFVLEVPAGSQRAVMTNLVPGTPHDEVRESSFQARPWGHWTRVYFGLPRDYDENAGVWGWQALDGWTLRGRVTAYVEEP